MTARQPHQSPFTGIFVPTVVPLHTDGRINEPELRRLVDYLIDRGVAGLYPNGSTGEFLRFTAEERIRIATVVLDQAAGRVPVLAGVAEPTVAATVRECGRYADLGATAAAVVAPFYFRLREESVEAWFDEIARQSPLDLLLYNIPAFASEITVPVVQRLATGRPRVIGLKDSSGDIAVMSRLAAAVDDVRPDFALLTGWDTTLVAMLLTGADGGTNASANVVPEVITALYEAAVAGDLSTAWRLQRLVTPLFDRMLDAEFPVGFRVATALRGIAIGPSRVSQTASQRSAADTLAGDLRNLLQPMNELLCPL